MKMKTNYHTHTNRCRHAQGTEADYVTSALQSHIDILGFSDHAPFPDYDFGLRMPYEELDPYLQSIDSLTKKYSTDIILLKSLEIEYLPEYHSYYEFLLSEKKMDYLLLGEHFYKTDSGILKNITMATGTDWYPEYASAISKALRTGYFKILAHPDLCLMNPFAWDKNCDIAFDIILDALSASGATVEYNANGLRRGIHKYPDGERLMYPDHRFWRQVAKTDIPVIVGSDCHNPTQVWDHALDLAYQNLQELGITPVFRP